MTQKVISLACPGCGARVSTDQTICEYCSGPVIISTFESVRSMPLPEVNKYARAYRDLLAENPGSLELNTSVAMCYLKLKLYDKAIPAFEKAMDDNFDNPDVFFHAAACLLRGQKAFTASRADIDKAMEYLNAAIMIEPRGIYHYLLAYIKYDYFHRKYLNISPSYKDEIEAARDKGTPPPAIEQLFALLGVEIPAAMLE
jgi:tetratricopeptide (TPR) repeat protein